MKNGTKKMLAFVMALGVITSAVPTSAFKQINDNILTASAEYEWIEVNNFNSFVNAFYASDNPHIRLSDDISYTDPASGVLEIGNNPVIDLNGKKVGCGNIHFEVTEGGSLEITDSSEDTSGVLCAVVTLIDGSGEVKLSSGALSTADAENGATVFSFSSEGELHNNVIVPDDVVLLDSNGDEIELTSVTNYVRAVPVSDECVTATNYEEVKNALSNNKNVILANDITDAPHSADKTDEENDILVNGDVFLDLNGKTIDLDNNLIKVDVEQTLTVKDSSENKAGLITGQDIGINVAGGKLVIESMTVEITGSAAVDAIVVKKDDAAVMIPSIELADDVTLYTKDDIEFLIEKKMKEDFGDSELGKNFQTNYPNSESGKYITTVSPYTEVTDYASLKAELEEGKKVSLLSNITNENNEGNIVLENDAKLNLNGHTLDLADNSIMCYNDDCVFEIYDSSSENDRSGKIKADTVAVVANTNLIFTSGTIEAGVTAIELPEGDELSTDGYLYDENDCIISNNMYNPYDYSYSITGEELSVEPYVTTYTEWTEVYDRLDMSKEVTNGGKIRIIDNNLDEDDEMPSKKDYTPSATTDTIIDLNGYTWNMDEWKIACADLQEGVSLTICDTASGKTGTVISEVGSIIDAEGTSGEVIIAGGTFITTADAPAINGNFKAAEGVTIYNAETGDVILPDEDGIYNTECSAVTTVNPISTAIVTNEEEFEAALTEGGKIKIDADFECDGEGEFTVNPDTDNIIDLNGHKIDLLERIIDLDGVSSEKPLTIIDSSEAKTGTLTAAEAVIDADDDACNLLIESGTFKSESDAPAINGNFKAAEGVTIYNAETGDVILPDEDGIYNTECTAVTTVNPISIVTNEDEFEAALAKGGQILIDADFECYDAGEFTVNPDTDTVIDLNGHRINLILNKIVFDNGAPENPLTIIDSSEAKTGIILGTSGVVATENDNCNLLIKGGSFVSYDKEIPAISGKFSYDDSLTLYGCEYDENHSLEITPDATSDDGVLVSSSVIATNWVNVSNQEEFEAACDRENVLISLSDDIECDYPYIYSMTVLDLKGHKISVERSIYLYDQLTVTDSSDNKKPGEISSDYFSPIEGSSGKLIIDRATMCSNQSSAISSNVEVEVYGGNPLYNEMGNELSADEYLTSKYVSTYQNKLFTFARVSVDGMIAVDLLSPAVYGVNDVEAAYADESISADIEVDLKIDTVEYDMDGDGEFENYTQCTYYVPAKNLYDEVKITANGRTQIISAADLLKTIEQGAYEDEQKSLAGNILMYTDAAKKYFADEECTYEPYKTSEEKLGEYLYEGTKLPKNLELPEGIEFAGASLILKTGTRLRIYFKTETPESYILTAKSGNDTIEYRLQDHGDGFWYIDLGITDNSPRGYKLSELSDIYTISINDAVCGEVSAADFMMQVINDENSDKNLAALFKNLYAARIAADPDAAGYEDME